MTSWLNDQWGKKNHKLTTKGSTGAGSHLCSSTIDKLWRMVAWIMAFMAEHHRGCCCSPKNNHCIPEVSQWVSFCNFPSPTIRHQHPLGALSGQLCGGERSHRLIFSLYLSFFYTTICCTFHVYSQVWHSATPNVSLEKLSENVHHNPHF